MAGSIILSILATGLEGFSYVLLVPTLQSLISGNLNPIRQFHYFEKWIENLPVLSDASMLFFALGLVFLTTFLKNIMQVLFDLSSMVQTRDLTNRLRLLLYERYLNFGKLFFDQRPLGLLQHILLGYPRQIAQSLRTLQQAFYSMAMLVISLGIMIKISWGLTAAAVFLWVCQTFLISGLIRQIRQASAVSVRRTAELTKKVSNALGCMPLIKACSAESGEIRRLTEPGQAADKAAMSVTWKQFLIGPIQELSGVIIIFILMGVMTQRLIGINSVLAASYLVFFLILRRSIPLLGAFSRLRASLAALQGPLLELQELFSDENKFYVSSGFREFEGVREKIQFSNLSFEYPGRSAAVKDATFEIQKGRLTALVGPSGAGKSTIIHLLMRFYECLPGTILMDGQDLRDFNLKSYHKRVAFVSQDMLLFNDTIRFNLNYGLETAVSETALASALKQARLDDFIMKLPQGLETPVGDRGIRLSGGEKQRLAIARALLRNAEILILDEATSALDGETERLIQEALAEAVKGRTTLVVAHRFSTIRHADQIVTLDEGRVVETGPLKELLEAKGLFSRLWEAQRFY